ncbi:MAG: hypothetical protein WAU68_10210 [Vitreimonas sp.]
MLPPPIPQRIPALSWRKPAILWTPIALALAIGWPALLFYNDYGLQQLVVIAGAAVFALALMTLGATWMLRRPPKTRRTVVMHVVIAGAIASFIAPFVLTQLLAVVTDYSHAGAAANFTLPMAMTMLPLALVLGLPVALVSAIMFSWIALKRQLPLEPHDLLHDGMLHNDIQPFR